MSGIDVKTAALIVLITLSAAFFICFLCDYLIKLSGRPTISQLVWQDPILGIPVMLPLVGMVGALAVHLFWK